MPQIKRRESSLANSAFQPQPAKVTAFLDSLTGIANRRNLSLTLQRWVAAHEKSEDPFTASILDIDDFQQINDGYGHQTGDQVLILAAADLSGNIRSTDFVARYGGDEFVILSAGMRLSEAERRFSNLLRMIKSKSYVCKSAEGRASSVSLTASCGVAEYGLGESANELIRRAGKAVRLAKREGKNRVVAGLILPPESGSSKQESKRLWCPFV
jgi:diguanylate cyclase (GGDEF)-like protein